MTDKNEENSGFDAPNGWTVRTNFNPDEIDFDVNVMSFDGLMDEVDAESREWFRTHMIELDTDSGESDGFLSDLTSSLRTKGATAPSKPATGPSPSPTPYARGTFAFPNDEYFMQSLEVRAKNGAHNRVETVYVLTGDSYTDPSELFALDNSEYYRSATSRSVVSFSKKMADAIASLYPDGETPQLIARFHTHPEGSVSPSDADQNSARAVEESFERAFGTKDFEFFHGIHAYIDYSNTTTLDECRQPETSSNGISWYGEQYRHELALYGPEFRNPRKVVINNDV